MEHTRWCIEVQDEWTARDLEEWLRDAAQAVGHPEVQAEVHGLAVIAGRIYAEATLLPPAAAPAVLRLAATAGRALGWLDPPGCEGDNRNLALPPLPAESWGFTPARWDAEAHTWQPAGFVPCAQVHYVVRKTTYFRFSVLRK